MSHQALARKWRPAAFAEVVGQDHVVRALSNALDQDRLHHAFLFTGTRGVGKTTLARILARCFNCEQGPTSQPCGECVACREIREGRHVDLLEVDAASQTKVEQTRELLENAQYAPTRGRFKIYLIDEVHMLSRSSFNALLKTLEEPPGHIKFLLATTDPQKLPVTVLSRCLQFNLRSLPAEQIRDQLRRVLDGESVAADDEALWRLARAADGSLRDALSLTDQAIAFCDGRLDSAGVRDMLGTIDADVPWRALERLAAGDGEGLLQLADAASAQGAHFESLLEEIAECLHRVAVRQAVPEYAAARTGADPREETLAASLPAEEVQLLYQICVAGRRDLPLAPEPRLGAEMTLLRMLAFLPAESADSVMPAAGGEPAAAPKKKTAERGAGVTVAIPAAPPQPAAPAPESSPAAAPTPPAPAAKSAGPAPAGTPGGSASGPAGEAARAWLELHPRLELQGVSARVVSECGTRVCTPEQVTLVVPPAHAALLNDTRIGEIRAAIRQALGRDTRVETEVSDAGICSPAGEARRIAALRKAEAVAALERDPVVRALRDQFGAQISMDTVRSVTDS